MKVFESKIDKISNKVWFNVELAALQDILSKELFTNNDIENVKMKQSIIDREKFRQALADLGHPEATVYSSWVLEAYDKVHCPELRKEKEIK